MQALGYTPTPVDAQLLIEQPLQRGCSFFGGVVRLAHVSAPRVGGGVAVALVTTGTGTVPASLAARKRRERAFRQATEQVKRRLLLEAKASPHSLHTRM